MVEARHPNLNAKIAVAGISKQAGIGRTNARSVREV